MSHDRSSNGVAVNWMIAGMAWMVVSSQVRTFEAVDVRTHVDLAVLRSPASVTKDGVDLHVHDSLL